jgi:hypothetical protein
MDADESSSPQASDPNHQLSIINHQSRGYRLPLFVSATILFYHNETLFDARLLTQKAKIPQKSCPPDPPSPEDSRIVERKTIARLVTAHVGRPPTLSGAPGYETSFATADV